MTTRKTPGNARRDTPKSSPGRGGSLITGLFIGLVVGLVVAAGLAWYLNNRTPTFKTTEITPPSQGKVDSLAQNERTSPEKKAPAESAAPAASEPKLKPEPKAPPAPAAVASPPKPAAETAAPKSRVDYTFYGILPGDKPSKQALPAPTPQPSKDIWWLQVAALKNPAEAEKLKAKLTLLGLNVAMQKIASGDVDLYRIRVGPYGREDDAFGDLDTLAANDFEPRLFKDPSPSASLEKP